MNEYPIDLYCFFDNDMTLAFKKFCRRVNNSNADVFIIMAHKAVLLFDLLLEMGHLNKRIKEKVIISNLALDFDCSYLEGKRVAILDDIVISGTTIASVVNKLISVGVQQDNIDIIAVAIDQDYFNMSFENTCGNNVLHCDFTPKDATCIELSAVISKVFSYYGIPYDVDFPVYQRIPVSDRSLTTLHSNLLWDVVEVSNGNQQSGNISVYTIFPTSVVLQRLWDVIGADLRCCGDIKLRMYIKTYPDGTRECCIVPMCLFREISQDVLSTLYALMKPTNKPLDLDVKNSWKAKMRYLEFFVAHWLFVIFSKLTSLQFEEVIDKMCVTQLFGPIDGETVYSHINVSVPCSNSILRIRSQTKDDYFGELDAYRLSDSYKKLCAEKENWEDKSDYQKGCWINRFVFSIFLWWYDTKEIYVRNQLKAHRLNYVKDYKTIQSYLYRLKNGLPMSNLGRILQDVLPNLSDHEINCIISSFIDRAIDEGIVVPTIYYSEKRQCICRAYRHGEDLPFGIADQYRLVYFVRSIGTYIYNEQGAENLTMGQITMEKIIVLFYQMGLRRGNIFNRFLGFDQTKIIHSFLSIHGTILGYTDFDAVTHIYSEKDSTGQRYICWLTTWLEDKGLIEKWPEGVDDIETPHRITIRMDEIERYLTTNQRSAMSKGIQRNIDSIAELIGIWYIGMVRENKKDEFRDDITALTSCANRTIYASAIATEIHYFNNYWKKQAMFAMRETSDSQRLVRGLTCNRENKRYTAIITQGLHSGRTKVLWRRSHKAQEVIERATNYFLSSISKDMWVKFWSHVDEEIWDEADSLKNPTNSAEAFLYFFSACFECLKSTEYWNNGDLPEWFSTYKTSYQELVKCTPKLDDLNESRFDALEKVGRLDSADLGKKSMELQNLLRETLFSSEKCVQKIEELVQKMDPAYTVNYKSALILDITTFDLRQTEKALVNFFEQLPEDEEKTQLNLIRFPLSQEDASRFCRWGIFWGNVGPKPLDVCDNNGENEYLRCGKFLYDTFKTVCKLLNGCLVQIRGILLPHVLLGSTFNHNLQCNIKKNATTFYEEIVRPLEACYTSEKKMQLVLGLDRFVERSFINLFCDWNTCMLAVPINQAEWVTNCVLCEKNHAMITSNKPNLIERIAYSYLKVSCGQEKGLGFLMRLSGRVVCVSCNHIFVGYSKDNEPEAVSTYDPKVHFSMRPLAGIRQYQSKEDILPAQDEVILLEPCWNGDIPFDLCMLISLEDWGEATMDTKCKCYGCERGSTMKWMDPVHVAGASFQGYYQISADKGADLGEIQKGCSGGVYVNTDAKGQSRIIGMHEGRFGRNKSVRMIPFAAIQAAITALFKEK